jgi:hypothetical protein
VGAANKSYIKHSTSYDTSGSTVSAEVCSYQSKWQTKETWLELDHKYDVNFFNETWLELDHKYPYSG